MVGPEPPDLWEFLSSSLIFSFLAGKVYSFAACYSTLLVEKRVFFYPGGGA